MSENIIVDKLTNELEHLTGIYRALSPRTDDQSDTIGRTLRTAEIKNLGDSIDRLHSHVQTLKHHLISIGLASPDPSLEMKSQSTGVRIPTGPSRETDTYSVSHSDEGWRVHFQTGIAPYFGLEPHYSLLELIKRVESYYPEYRPCLTNRQLEEYALQLNHLVEQKANFVPEAVCALMRCAPPELSVYKKVILREAVERAFESGEGLSGVLEQFTQTKQKQHLSQNNHRAQAL
jgi:hypothetical protein